MPLFKPKRTQAKPAGAYSINWGHPLATGLQSLLLINAHGGGPFDAGAHKFLWDGGRNQLVTSTLGAGSGFVSNAAGHGFGIKLNTTGSTITIPGAGGTAGSDPVRSDRVTVLCIRRKTDSTLRSGALWGTSGGATNTDCALFAPNSSANNLFFDFGGNSGSNRLSISGQSWGTTPDMFAAVAGRQGLAVWRNGVKIGSSATVVTRTVSSSASFFINLAEGTSGDLQEIYLFGLFNEEWSDEMISWWMADPYAMLRSQNSRGTYYAPKLNKAAVTLPKLQVSGTAWFPYSGPEASTLKHLTVSAAGDVNEVGTEGSTLPHPFAVSGTGVVQLFAKGKVKLPRLKPSILLSEKVRRLIIHGTGRLDETGTASSTLRHLKSSGHGTLISSGTAAATLKHLAVRAGSGSDPATVTLRHLTVSSSGTILANPRVQANLHWKYKAQNGPSIAWIKHYKGSRQVQISRRIPAQTVQEFDVSFASAATVAFTLFASQAVTVGLNTGPVQTLNLSANQGLIWSSDSAEAFPFMADVAKLVVNNNNDTPARFTVSALIWDASN